MLWLTFPVALEVAQACQQQFHRPHSMPRAHKRGIRAPDRAAEEPLAEDLTAVASADGNDANGAHLGLLNGPTLFAQSGTGSLIS